MKEYQAGDIILFFNNDEKIPNDLGSIFVYLQKKFDGAVTHVEIIFDKLQNGKYRCLGSSNDGVKMREWDIKALPNLKVIRLKKDINYSIFQSIIWTYYTKLYNDKNLNYDYIGLIDAGINAMLKKINMNFEKESYLSVLDKLRGYDSKICSELVTEIYYQYLLITDENCLKEIKLNNQITSPGDYLRSKYFQEV